MDNGCIVGCSSKSKVNWLHARLAYSATIVYNELDMGI